MRLTTKKYDASSVATSLFKFEGVGGFVRVVRAAHERPGLHVDEAKIEGNALQFAEFIGVVVARHRRMFGRRAQILADGEDLAAHVPEVFERPYKFVVFLSESYH